MKGVCIMVSINQGLSWRMLQIGNLQNTKNLIEEENKESKIDSNPQKDIEIKDVNFVSLSEISKENLLANNGIKINTLKLDNPKEVKFEFDSFESFLDSLGQHMYATGDILAYTDVNGEVHTGEVKPVLTGLKSQVAIIFEKAVFIDK